MLRPQLSHTRPICWKHSVIFYLIWCTFYMAFSYYCKIESRLWIGIRSTLSNVLMPGPPERRQSDLFVIFIAADWYAPMQIMQNRHETPEWQSYRRSVSSANCTSVALWMLAILRSRYSRDTRWFVRSLPLCFYSIRKVLNRIHDCPGNHWQTENS